MEEIEFQALLDAEEHHWWFRGRRRIIDAQLRRLDLAAGCRILDAGCGSGRMLDELARYGEVAGIDTRPEAVDVARGRGHQRVAVAPVEELPFADEEFDLITSLDVVEHTPDDRRALAELLRVARPGGRLLVTVPAYQSLWSPHDERNGHFRRYRAGTLRAAAERAGWEPVSATYFNSLLLPPAALVRLASRLRPRRAAEDVRSELDATPRSLNGLLELPLRFEAALVRRGARLPGGLSLLAVFRKPASARAAPALRDGEAAAAAR